MLPAKYQPNLLSDSGDEVVDCFSPYMGMAAILNFES